MSDSDNRIIICWNIPRHYFDYSFVVNNSEDLPRDTSYIRQDLVSSPRFPFGDNNEDRWGTRSSHVSLLRPFGRWMVLAPRLRARPLSRERSKSKPTSQPIVNTGTTGEFNSIRTRSSDCSIVRHRISPARSCGPLYPLYLSLPPFRPLARNPQHSPLTLPWSTYALCARTYTSVDRNAHGMPFPARFYLPVRFYSTSLTKTEMYTLCAESIVLKLNQVFLRNFQDEKILWVM